MKITEPSYYRKFRCIASACPDSCCKEWDVQVDPDTASRYRTLPGELGDRLRQVLRDDPEYGTMMVIENGRCPMWMENGLCRIQGELGESALCATCRDFPRLKHDYGSFVELGLELSCPEAARWILFSAEEPPVVRDVPGGEPGQYARDAMTLLLQSRAFMLRLLQDPTYHPGEALALGLMYACHIQAQLDGGDAMPFDPAAALSEARAFAIPGPVTDLPAFYAELEILTSQWKTRLSAPAPTEWSAPFRALARYGVERYWLQAVSDLDLVCRVKLIIGSCLIVKLLGGPIEQTAQLYAKEIENNVDNVDAILDAAYTHPAFADNRLLGLLLAEEESI